MATPVRNETSHAPSVPAGRWAAQRELFKKYVWQALRDYGHFDLRISHVIIGAMVVVGAVVNLLLAHGWTVWPFVMAASLMIVVHEAAQRNGQGIPPFHVYVWFAGTMAAWLALVIVLSALNPLIVLAGLAAVVYYGVQGHLKHVRHLRLIASRRAQNLCIHCGHPINPDLVYCARCGEEPDPDTSQLQRIAHMSRSAQDRTRTRAALAPKPPTEAAAIKEQALLARRHRSHSRRK